MPLEHRMSPAAKGLKHLSESRLRKHFVQPAPFLNMEKPKSGTNRRTHLSSSSGIDSLTTGSFHTPLESGLELSLERTASTIKA